MHYIVYLDEFGHIGPFVSRDHAKYNDSPVFGLAGFLMPAHAVREFAVFFYQLKCSLLKWELKSQEKNPKQLPAYQWEKKGSSLYTVKNVETYRSLRQATFRIINQIKSAGGYIFYTGEHKTTKPEEHESAEVFKLQLLQTIRKIDRFCADSASTFMVLLDEQQAGDEWREKNVEACTLAMFESATDKCRTLIEPPLQGESHLFQTLQCADWICGLVGRLTAYSVAPSQYSDWEIFNKYFNSRLLDALLPNSGLEHQKSFPIPPEKAGETLPDAEGKLAGEN